MNETTNMELCEDPIFDKQSTGAIRSDVQAIQQQAVLPVVTTPMQLLAIAVQGGADMEKLERLMALQERWEANEARKAFAEAMAEFKKNPPKIFKDKQVSFKSQAGKTEYMHATIGNVNEKIIARLAECGLSHRWVPTQENGKIAVECIITHRQGHSEGVKLEASADSSGGKNAIQAIVSAKTYLERHTLLAATGMATNDEDDDGKSFGTAEVDTTLADNWIAKVNAAPTDAEVVNVWNVGIVAIEKAGDKNAHKEFKKAVEDRRTFFAEQAEKPAKKANK